jgi:hypothetical protein
MKTMQINALTHGNPELLRAAGIKRIHPGWYTVTYRGPKLDSGTITSAKRNPKGEIKFL